MAKVKEYVIMDYPRNPDGSRNWNAPQERVGGWRFMCPGCGYSHSFDYRWEFNGDADRPTFKPSLLLKIDDGWYYDCHSFVKDGRIIFLSDCTHELAGQTVELPEME